MIKWCRAARRAHRSRRMLLDAGAIVEFSYGGEYILPASAPYIQRQTKEEQVCWSDFIPLCNRDIVMWRNTGGLAVRNCANGFYTFSILNYIFLVHSRPGIVCCGGYLIDRSSMMRLTWLWPPQIVMKIDIELAINLFSFLFAHELNFFFFNVFFSCRIFSASFI